MRPRRQVNAIRLDGVPECPFEPFVALCAPVVVPTRRLPLSPCDEGGGDPLIDVTITEDVDVDQCPVMAQHTEAGPDHVHVHLG